MNFFQNPIIYETLLILPLKGGDLGGFFLKQNP